MRTIDPLSTPRRSVKPFARESCEPCSAAASEVKDGVVRRSIPGACASVAAKASCKTSERQLGQIFSHGTRWNLSAT